MSEEWYEFMGDWLDNVWLLFVFAAAVDELNRMAQQAESGKNRWPTDLDYKGTVLPEEDDEDDWDDWPDDEDSDYDDEPFAW